MTRPIIAEKRPAKTELEAGKTYYWCRCGRSKTQPFCDGSHKGTGLEPLAFTVQESRTGFLCRCKGTANAPYCDGTHARLGDNEIGDEIPNVGVGGPPVVRPTLK